MMIELKNGIATFVPAGEKMLVVNVNTGANAKLSVQHASLTRQPMGNRPAPLEGADFSADTAKLFSLPHDAFITATITGTAQVFL